MKHRTWIAGQVVEGLYVPVTGVEDGKSAGCMFACAAQDHADFAARTLNELERAVKELTPRALFGDQCLQDDCENAYIRQTVLKRFRDDIAAVVSDAQAEAENARRTPCRQPELADAYADGIDEFVRKFQGLIEDEWPKFMHTLDARTPYTARSSDGN